MRDTLILIALGLAAIVVGALVYFLGGGSTSVSQTAAAPESATSMTSVPVAALAVGTQSLVTTPTNFLITSQSELERLWGMTDASGQVPQVDFRTHSVLAVFAGQEPTAGYSIAVSKVDDSLSERVVTITLTRPGGSCVVGQVATAPYELVSVASTTLPLTHATVESTASCLQ